MVANGVRAAPLWDSKKQSFVGEERRAGSPLVEEHQQGGVLKEPCT